MASAATKSNENIFAARNGVAVARALARLCAHMAHRRSAHLDNHGKYRGAVAAGGGVSRRQISCARWRRHNIALWRCAYRRWRAQKAALAASSITQHRHGGIFHGGSNGGIIMNLGISYILWRQHDNVAQYGSVMA